MLRVLLVAASVGLVAFILLVQRQLHRYEIASVYYQMLFPLAACPYNGLETFSIVCRAGTCTQAECVRALKGLALPRANLSGKIAGRAYIVCVPSLRQQSPFRAR